MWSNQTKKTDPCRELWPPGAHGAEGSISWCDHVSLESLHAVKQLLFVCQCPSGVDWEHPTMGTGIPCPHSTGHPGREPRASLGHSCHWDPPGSCTGSSGFVLDGKEHFQSGSVSPGLLVRFWQPWKGCAWGTGRWAAFGHVLCSFG